MNNNTHTTGFDHAIKKPNRESVYLGHLAAIVESSDDAIISKSMDGIIESWNRASEKMFGYTAQETIGHHISMIIPSEYYEEEKKIAESIRKNETIEQYQTVRKKKNGEVFYVSLTVSPIKDREGTMVGVSKIIRDITSLKRFETEQLDANKELQFQNKEKEKRAAELIIANKELAFQNGEKDKRAAELVIANRILAVQNTEKEKRAAELIIANKELAFQNEEKEKRASELIIANNELFFQNEMKEQRAAELIVANKELAFQNEEKEKRAAELTVANKALESFSYSVSHDLRAPLRHISGFVELLSNRVDHLLDEKAKHYLINISDSANQMGALIDDLLQFSRTGRQEMMNTNIDMDQALREALFQIKRDNPKRVIEWVIAPLPRIFGDFALLRQVWVNLLSNAVKFTRMRSDARIEIGHSVENEENIFFVRDNGVGFDMQYAQKLFGVFQRLHSSEEYEGTGIGLANIRQIISKHQGRTWAEAEPNKGAVIYFTIPMHSEERHAQS